MSYKLKPNKLEIGKNYFLIDYENDEVVEARFYNHDIDHKNEISFDFQHSITGEEDGVMKCERIYLTLKDGVLKENVGCSDYSAWVENPVFSTREEAEAKKKKYILASLKAVRKLILQELKENSDNIKKFRGK